MTQEAADLLAGIDELDAAALGAALTQHGVKAPETGNDISAPFAFNLMFKTSIGPRGDLTGYLRPETAQGIFVNFRCSTMLLLALGTPAMLSIHMCSQCITHIWVETALPGAAPLQFGSWLFQPAPGW